MLKDHFVIFIAIKHTKTLKPYENVYENGLYQPLQPTMKTHTTKILTWLCILGFTAAK